MKKHIFSLTGFTLAEVLITLTIIGVVAALTIPSLMQNVQDAQYKTAWKETYSQFSQATQRIMIDNGGTLIGTFTNGTDFTNKYLNYLNYAKKCNNSAFIEGCFHSTWHYLDGATIAPEDAQGFILNNGSAVYIRLRDSNCQSGVFGANNIICGEIYVDVNGRNGPDTMGRDMFGMFVIPKGIAPFGTIGDFINTCSASSAIWRGWGCSAEYLKQ